MSFNPAEKRDATGRWSKLAGLMKESGGFTHLMSGETNPSSGWSVGVKSADGKDWMTLPHGSTSAADIEAFRAKFADELAKPNRAIGGWSNSDPSQGEVRDALDVVEVHGDVDRAFVAARASNQDAVFDLKSFETFNTDQGGYTAAKLAAKRDREPVATVKMNDGAAPSAAEDAKNRAYLAKIADRRTEKEAKALRKATQKERNARDDAALKAAKEYRKAHPPTAWDVATEKRAAALKAAQKKRPFGLNLSVLTPSVSSDVELSTSDGKLAFWKQILPLQTIHYTAKDGTRQTLDFTADYLADLAKNKAVDKVPFLLADHDNRHTMDPERYRGDVVEMQVRGDGLYGKIVFPTVEAAKAIIDNPNLGVSARIREGVGRSDGSTVNRGIIHVLGTLDPQVGGMSPWQTADLSNEAEVLDLSNEEYTVDKKIEDYTDEEIAAMSDVDLDAFLGELGFSAEDIAEDIAELEAPDEVEPTVETREPTVETREPVTASLSNEAGNRDIELANARAEQAIAQARATAQRLADAEWRETRSNYLAAGVPPFALDLAKPVLSRPDDMVVDLSNEGSDDLNTSKVVRGLLDAMKGMVDLSNEQGHGGTFSPTDTEDPDAALLAQWAQVN